jgi:ADP-heptose:LPS heptosyltransferase
VSFKGENAGDSVLVHVASGVGNIVFASPLLLVLSRHRFIIDVLIDGDYRGTADLFRGWSALLNVYDGAGGEQPLNHYDICVPAIPPFYWNRYAARYRAVANAINRPPDELFYRNEQAYYLEFARELNCSVSPPPHCFLPVPADETCGVTGRTLVLAPGCKTGVMAAKRWPHFPELASLYDDVTVVGTEDDLYYYNGTPMRFPAHVRSVVGRLSLRETAGVLAAAGAVVANDSGLGYVAAAVGVPTILLFGPTSDAVLGSFPPNVKLLRAGLPCEPCWHGKRLTACASRIDCLPAIGVETVADAVAERLMPASAANCTKSLDS